MLDVVFLLDSSGTISDKQWNKIQKFTEELARGLKVNADGNKGAIVTFSDNAQAAVRCDSTNTLKEFLIEVRNLTRGNAFTNIIDALRVGLELIKSKGCLILATRNVAKTFVLISDGQANFPRNSSLQELYGVATNIRARGVWIYAISIGENYRYVLENIVDVRNHRHRLFDASSYSALSNTLANEVAQNVCQHTQASAMVSVITTATTRMTTTTTTATTSPATTTAPLTTTATTTTTPTTTVTTLMTPTINMATTTATTLPTVTTITTTGTHLPRTSSNFKLIS